MVREVFGIDRESVYQDWKDVFFTALLRKNENAVKDINNLDDNPVTDQFEYAIKIMIRDEKDQRFDTLFAKKASAVISILTNSILENRASYQRNEAVEVVPRLNDRIIFQGETFTIVEAAPDTVQGIYNCSVKTAEHEDAAPNPGERGSYSSGYSLGYR